MASAGRQNHSVVVGAPDEPLSQHHVKDGRDRQQRDQQVEPVRADEMFDSAHALNVLRPLRSRLLPK